MNIITYLVGLFVVGAFFLALNARFKWITKEWAENADSTYIILLTLGLAFWPIGLGFLMLMGICYLCYRYLIPKK